MRAFLVVNPRSGGGRITHQLDEAIALLRSFGWEVDIAVTNGRSEGTSLARRAVASGYDVVVACGGDGTNNEVLQALVGTHIPLGVIPLGTGNVFARQEGIPLEPVAAARALATGMVREIDVGEADGRYFLLWIGMGFDAEVVRALERDPRSKQRWGIGAFALAALWQGLRYRSRPARLRVDDKIINREIFLLLACNARTYALLEVAQQARMDDGKLDVLVFEGRGLGAKMCLTIKVLSGRLYDSAHVEYFQTSELIVRGAERTPAQVDGEPFPGPVARVGVVPKGLRVILPA